jgi:hypothetical protein
MQYTEGHLRVTLYECYFFGETVDSGKFQSVPCSWSQQVPSIRWYIFTTLHGATFHKTVTL